MAEIEGLSCFYESSRVRHLVVGGITESMVATVPSEKWLITKSMCLNCVCSGSRGTAVTPALLNAEQLFALMMGQWVTHHVLERPYRGNSSSMSREIFC